MRPLSRHWLIFLLFLLIATAASLRFVFTRAYAAGQTYTVNSTADTDDGVCDATNCTLREAINAANGHPGPDTINFSVSGTITLSSLTPEITDALKIDGAGQTIILDGAHQHTVLRDDFGFPLSLKNLTITNGHGDICANNADPSTCDGGGLFAFLVAIDITNCTFSNNSAGRFGGAIAQNGGTLVITNSTFSNNTAPTGGAVCGGVCATLSDPLDSRVTVINSTFSNNHASSKGGAISYNGDLNATNSSFSGNSGGDFGGAINVDEAFNVVGSLNVTDSSLSGNSSSDGGGISASFEPVTISGSTLSGNSASGTGGGIENESGDLTVTDSIFSNNAANQGGGMWTRGSAVVVGSTFSGNQAQEGGAILNAIHIFGFVTTSLHVAKTTFSGNNVSSNTTTPSGGAILNIGNDFTVTGCTFSGNTASSDSQPAQGGAISMFSSANPGVEVTNSTFSLNSCSSKSNGASGGAIYNKAAALHVTNSTLSENFASAASGFSASGGGIYTESSPSGSLRNTIVANSTSGGDCVIASGTLTGTNNLIKDSSSACGLINGTNGNLIGLDPQLGPLANHGGPTSTFALLSGSPALNAGADATTLSGGINDTVTSIVVADATAFPAGVGFVIRVDDEKMVVVDKTSNTLTVTRHANGTPAGPHSGGATVNAAFDQRGGQRKFGATIDIGAYEFGSPIITPSGPIHLCPGGSVLLTSTIAAGNQWYLNGNPIGGATSQHYLATAIGDYAVVATTGSVISDPSTPVTVTFNPPPAPPPTPTITAGGPTLICDGSSVTLNSSSADGNQWYLNGNPIAGATAQQYPASAAGNYSVVVTINACVSATSNQIHVIVNSLPPVPTITPGGPTTFQMGGSVLLTTSSATGNQWLLNGNPIAGATGQQYQATEGGDYTVSVTDNICASVSAPITVTTIPDPDRFVATGGTDTNNDCLDIANPCATIQYALNLSPYGVIHVAAGSYTEGAIVFTGDGTVLGSQDGTTVTADFQVSSNNRKVRLRYLTIIPSATQPYPIGATNIVVGGTTNLTVDQCTIAATLSARIFAVDHTAALTINDSMLSNGSALAAGSSGGGCIYDNGTLVMSNTTVTGCNGLFGGAILIPLGGNATISNSTFDTNTASFNGGAIESDNSSILTVSGSTFKTNSATSGGGIYNLSATTTVTDSTFSGNNAGNSGLSQGGGIYNKSGSLTVNNSTFVKNSGAELGGAIFDNLGTLTLNHTILAGSPAGGDFFEATPGQSTVTGSYNLIQDGSSLNLFSNSLSGDPHLGPLENNGGPTQTFLLLPGSPAIDAGNPAFAPPPASDQRGFPRLVNGHVDIGSVEVNYAINATSGTPQSTAINSIFGTPLQATVTESGNIQSGLPVIFTAPSSGPSGTFPGNVITATVNTNGSGVSTAPAFTANATAGGPYNVVASLTGGSPSSNFVLTNLKGDQTIIINTHAPATATYNSSFTVSAVATSGLPVNYGSSGACTNVGAVFTITSSTGTCTVTYNQPGNVSYNPAPQLLEAVTAQKANQTITFAALSNKTFLDPDFVVGATASSGLPVSFAATGNCMVTSPSPGTVHITSAGSCTITGSQAGDGNFNAAPNAIQSFTIARADQTINFNALPNKTFGDADFPITATASSAMPVSFAATGNCTVTTPSPATVDITGAGPCTITASQAGNNNFNPAPNVARSFNIFTAPTALLVTSSVNPSDLSQNVTFAATVSSSFGTPTGTVQFKDNGTNLGSTVVLNSGGLAQISTSTLTAGTHSITADYSGAVNYAVSTGPLAGGQVVRPQPTLSINDVSISEGDSGTQILNFTVTLSAASNLTVTVNFATADGTATAPSDYLANSGTLTFNPGETTKPIGVNINGDVNFETDESFLVNLSNAVNATISKGIGTGTIKNDDPLGGVISLSQANYNVAEATGVVTVTINRGKDARNPVTIDYATDDTGAPLNCGTLNSGLASARCDFTPIFGTLQFAANETQKTIDIPINRDGFVEGPEVFRFVLTNPAGGAVLGLISSSTLTITDSSIPSDNAIDDPDLFVRQQYHDFLNREPDAAGLAFWVDNINKCNDPMRIPPGLTVAQCIDTQRTITSAAFFLSIEFRQTGGLVRDFYVAALNRPATNNMPSFVEFTRDTQAVQRGVAVGQGNWQTQLAANRLAFMNDFVMRGEFVGLYPTTDTPAQYVDKLYLHANVTPGSAPERTDAIAEFGGAATAADPGARGRALLRITQNAAFQARELNRGFVQLQYFGYLRRNPNDPPDGNFNGYNFWLNKLNQFNGDYLQAELVKAFITSNEYRARFGP